MKKIIFAMLFLSTILAADTYAQNGTSPEKFGRTLNMGVGVGYYGYIGYSTPVLHANYEFDVARNFTLAPFVTFYSYRNYSYWGNPNYAYKNYYYRQTVVPIGVKASYYFDELFHAGPKWDFYAAGSLGFAIRSTTWENGYYGNTTINRGPGALYLDVHVGTEYHMNKQLGLFLDLSTGISTAGLAVHF